MKDRREKSVEILVFGTIPPCVQCAQAERVAREAAANYPAGTVSVAKHEAWSEMGQRYGVAVTPTVVVAGEVVSAGRALQPAELDAHLRRALGETEP